ncbi:sensor histidine kinase [Cytophaga hutchinsonii]|uniref:Two-component sensor histidine kinase n=1 Tax=Cytophaga hutchinsonii (strain ATCC 33406 / DSM 1761 / CIP 103989 / NBRC 15051 / NCIMB 9469 / D465) TaxID=269798 RepID=A0A6N4STR7_CYTH3|nr:histidine kinase [Cytophaga hutchinsonii]ABG59829.1 two-component sensor histidine kinase [Cytophaga hutchinsonii ATCC 33406]SFX29143.1 hypothetical protein SAMN04487930_102475 [Cytophaga hutchinsonii ATCC 33406]
MNTEKDIKRSYIFIGTHVIVWVVLFSLPYLLSVGDEFNLMRNLRHSTIPLVYCLIIFYTNYFILIDRFWFSPNKSVFILLNIIMVVFFVFVNYEVKKVCCTLGVVKPNAPPLQLYLYVDMISLIIPVLFSIGLKTYERWMGSEDIHRQAANEKLISELQHLKYQLQPHFFFNSLNNIYSLIDQHPEQAKEVVHSLGKLMRYLLYDTSVEMIPLSKEIDFMKRYIELMQLRTSTNTAIEANFSPLEKNIDVAPLLFISLIENAFKHGVSASQKSTMRFNLSVKNDTIVFTTENLYIPKDVSDKSGSGIGLENMEKRLALLYPDAHEFKREVIYGIYHTTLRIQYLKYTQC